MKTLKNLTTSLLVLAIALLVIGFAATEVQHAKADTSSVPTVFFKVATSTPETVSASNSTTVLATSTGRTWAKLSNNSPTAIYCTYGVPAAQFQGFLIQASTTYEMNQLSSPVYAGPVNCIGVGAAATIWVQANQ